MPTPPSRTVMLPLASLLLAALLTLPTHAEPPLTGTWRFTHARPAPWGPVLPGAANLTGQTLTLNKKALTGPSPLACPQPKLEVTRYPAEGLFQGNLPAPAANPARELGLGQFPVPGLRITCAQGLFEFHRADADTLLLGLDNRVWTLSRAPGAQARADSPAGRVERLLEQHFSGDMGFDPSTIQAKAPYQSQRLNRLIAGYLARPPSPDLVPSINGDPYTSSQEYPTRFAVDQARIKGSTARVPVRFADGWKTWRITYHLVREGGAWQLDDLDFPMGGHLQGLLQ